MLLRSSAGASYVGAYARRITGLPLCFCVVVWRSSQLGVREATFCAPAQVNQMRRIYPSSGMAGRRRMDDVARALPSIHYLLRSRGRPLITCALMHARMNNMRQAVANI